MIFCWSSYIKIIKRAKIKAYKVYFLRGNAGSTIKVMTADIETINNNVN
jgi:hypothetical protein